MAKQRQITTLTGPAAELLQTLAQVRGADAVADTERAQTSKRGGLLTGVGCVSIFGSFFLLGFLLPVALTGFAVGIALLVGGFVHLRRAGKLAELDLDNERLAVVSELLDLLRPDLSDKKPITLTLAHGPAATWAPATNVRTEGGWLGGKTHYAEHEDTWLRLGGRLQDGSLFRLSVTESLKRKSKPKRKYTKITDRSREKVALSLRVSPAFYPHLDRLQARLLPERLLAGAGLTASQCLVSGPTVRVQAVTGLNTRQVLRYSQPQTGQENRINSAKLIGLLAFVFAGLSHCRMDAAAPPAEAPPAAAPTGPPAS